MIKVAAKKIIYSAIRLRILIFGFKCLYLHFMCILTKCKTAFTCMFSSDTFQLETKRFQKHS